MHNLLNLNHLRQKIENSTLFSLAVLILAGGITALAFAPKNISIIFVLSILIFHFVFESQNSAPTRKKIFFLGYAYGFAYFASQLYWLFNSLYYEIDAGFIISTIAFVTFVGILALYFGIITLLFNQLKTKFSIFNYLILFPSVWVFFEWVRGWLFTGFSWCDVGYTVVNAKLFRGVYPLFGSYAVSWLTLSLISAVYLILKIKLSTPNNKTRLKLRMVLLFTIAVILGSSLVADIRYTTPYGKPITVALVQGNIPQTAKFSTDEYIKVYKDAIAKARADLVIIPETAISTFSEYLPHGYLDALKGEAESNGAGLIIGIPKIIDKQNNYVNTATVVTGNKTQYYAKYHLVPFGEYIPFNSIFAKVYTMVALPMVGFSPGAKDQLPLIVANQKLAVNICYENGFNTELIKSARHSTMMANLSDMVWYGNTSAEDQHLQISQARALENQRYFIQDTNTGLTAIISPDGVVQSMLPPFTRSTLIDTVQGVYGVTPFERWGNYPIIILCLMLLLIGCIIKKQFKK